MIKCVPVILLLTCLLACSPKEEPAPEHLDKQKMSEVMADMALMEAAISQKTGIDPARNIDSSSRFNIYKQHNISRGLYDSSMKYYSARPVEFKEVYDLVVTRLDNMRSEK
jgi:hypothetical protein